MQELLPVFQKRRKSAFTLVELIVVITILAILGTIGFLSVNGYSTKARDSSRVADLAQLSKGLDVLVAGGGTLPLPDTNMITLSASGVVIGYQGGAGANVIRESGFGGKGVDPLDGNPYTYVVNLNRNTYQFLTLLEAGNSTAFDFPILPIAYAGAYDTRIASLRGSTLGVLVGTGANANQPLQEFLGSGSLDISSTTSNYTILLSKELSISGTGSTLRRMESFIASPSGAIDQSTTADIANGSLVGFWDMETLTSDGKLRDLSGNGNHGTSTGGVIVGSVSGKFKKATSFNGTPQGVLVADSNSLRVTNQTSFGGWFNMSTSAGIGHMNLFTKHWPVQLRRDANVEGGNLSAFVYDTAGWEPRVSGVMPTGGTWAHVFIVYNQSSSTLKMYRNGVQVASSTKSRTMQYLNGQLGIGFDPNTPQNSFNGMMDEMRMYNRALSDAEVLALYNATK